jgi:large subunit ribosomal protein L10
LPLSRSEKVAVVEQMAARLKECDALVLADYRGLDVAEMTELRTSLRKHGSEIHVIKNTLVRRAFELAEMETPEALLSGPTAIALFFEDLSSPAKALLDFAEEHDVLQIKGGMLEGDLLDAAGVDGLSSLPTKDEVRSMILGVLTAPRRQVVTVLHAPLRDLVSVIRNYSETGGEAGEEAAD